MRALAIDPSFTRTGVFLNGEAPYGFEDRVTTKVIGHSFMSFSTSIEEKSFPGTYISVRRLVEELNLLVLAYKPTRVIMEYPPPQSSYSPGLFALDVQILDMFIREIGEVYMIGPQAINSYCGKRTVSKSVIVNLVKKEIGVPVKRLNHDMASAYILYRIIRKWEKEAKGPTIYKAVNEDDTTTVYKIKNEKQEIIAEHASKILTTSSLH